MASPTYRRYAAYHEQAHEEYPTSRPEAHPAVCRIERHSDLGPGCFFFVRLPDGHLLDCGTDPFRALTVARLLED